MISRTVTGFTLIEMSMVLVLIGILAVGARALFVSGDGFSAAIARDQLVTTIRLAQQAALAKNDGSSVTLTVSEVSGSFVFAVSHAGDVTSRAADSGSATITWSTLSLTGSCATVTGALPHTLTFNNAGNTTKTRYCIGGSNPSAVCVSGLGFAYEGDCET